MQLKVFQLNMWGGQRFPALKDFLKTNDFDILCFQEVAGPNSHAGNMHSDEDQYKKLQDVLGAGFDNQFYPYVTFTSDPQNSFEGIGIFYKKDISFVSKKEMLLFDTPDPYPSDATSFEKMRRAALSVTLTKENKEFSVVTGHFAWATLHVEQPHQRKQNLKLIEYMKNLTKPWILTGDFNISPMQPSILDIEKLGKDLPKEYNVQNTIDEKVHVSWDQINPGFVVDYIFVSPQIKTSNFEVLNTVHLSDHYGLTATLEI